MCNCTGNCSCVIDLTGIGQQGNTGSQGYYGGYSTEFDFSTSTVSGTTSGLLRLDNATYASVTTIYVNKTNADATSVDSFLSSFSNGGSFGDIRIFKETNSNVFWLGRVTAVSSGLTEYTLTVTYVLHNGTFAANDDVILSFQAKGTEGKNLIFTYNGSATTVNTASWTSVTGPQMTIASGTLGTNGDFIDYTFYANNALGTADILLYNGIRGLLNATAISSGSAGYSLISGDEVLHFTSGAADVANDWTEINFRIIRISATTATVYTMVSYRGFKYVWKSLTATAVNNFSSSTNTIDIQVYNGDTASATIVYDVKGIKSVQ
jgi:hypothetical protein